MEYAQVDKSKKIISQDNQKPVAGCDEEMVEDKVTSECIQIDYRVARCLIFSIIFGGMIDVLANKSITMHGCTSWPWSVSVIM